MTRRPRGFQLGRMTDRVTIQSSSDTQDSAGQLIRSWSDVYADIPAHVRTVSGGETIRGKQIIQGVNKLITIRTQAADITSDQRVVFGSDNYGIVLATPVDCDSRSRYVEIQAKITDE